MKDRQALKESNRKFFFIIPSSHQHLHLFDDLKDEKNTKLIFITQKSVSRVLMLVRKIHTSHTVNKFIKLPFQNLWYKKIDFEGINENDYVVVLDGALNNLNPIKTNYLVKKKISLILLLINSLNAQSISMIEIRNKIEKFKWKNIYSFDPKDCEDRGFKYLGLSYYSRREVVAVNEVITDIYFVGGLKGNREKFILDTFKFLMEKGCSTKFQLMISGIRKFKPLKYDQSISYIRGKWLPYDDILKQISSSNCILEIVQEGQSGPSLRYFEAVCYNKKLLTNNKNIKNFPFYNEEYMKIYSEVCDIDICWLKKREEVNYYYNNEFSPKQLLNKIIN